MTHFSSMLALTLLLAVSACGSDDGDGGSGGQGGQGGSAGSSGSGGSAGSAGSVGSGALAAPVLEMVMPMAPAGLHVTWQNVQTDCDEIEGERKSASAEYTNVFGVPGYVDNSHDASATEAIEYTYRVRCKKGADYSPFSNEMSGMP
jgi:hypothetical protein